MRVGSGVFVGVAVAEGFAVGVEVGREVEAGAHPVRSAAKIIMIMKTNPLLIINAPNKTMLKIKKKSH